MELRPAILRHARPAILCALSLLAVAHADTVKMARVGYSPNTTHAPGIVGFCPQKQSFYKAFPGVAFNNRLFLTGSAAVEALRTNTVDLAFVDGGSAVAEYCRNRDIVVLTNVAIGGIVLVSRKGIGAIGVPGLQKRKVAVPDAADIQDVLLRYQLALNRLRGEDKGGSVAVIPIESPELLGLFLQKKIDAACVPEPWGSWLEREAGARTLLGTGQIFNEGDYPTTLLVARKEFADAHPEFVRRFRDVTREIALGISKNKAAYVPILQSEVKRLSGRSLAAPVIAASLRRCRFVTRTSQHNLQVFAILGEVAGTIPPGARLDGIVRN